MIESKVVEGTPQSIAQFLHTSEGLDKTQIGSYLGEKYVLLYVLDTPDLPPT